MSAGAAPLRIAIALERLAAAAEKLLADREVVGEEMIKVKVLRLRASSIVLQVTPDIGWRAKRLDRIGSPPGYFVGYDPAARDMQRIVDPHKILPPEYAHVLSIEISRTALLDTPVLTVDRIYLVRVRITGNDSDVWQWREWREVES